MAVFAIYQQYCPKYSANALCISGLNFLFVTNFKGILMLCYLMYKPLVLYGNMYSDVDSTNNR